MKLAAGVAPFGVPHVRPRTGKVTYNERNTNCARVFYYPRRRLLVRSVFELGHVGFGLWYNKRHESACSMLPIIFVANCIK